MLTVFEKKITIFDKQPTDVIQQILAESLLLKMKKVVEEELNKIGYSLNDLAECHILLANLEDYNNEELVDELVIVEPKAHLNIERLDIFKGVVTTHIVSIINDNFIKEDLVLLSEFEAADVWGNLALER